MNRHDPIYVAGHAGLVGSALVRLLLARGYDNLVLRSRADLDLRNQAETERFFEETRPRWVFLSAATVGGILANSSRPADFLYDNLMIAANVIAAARKTEVEKLLNLGSSCIYPRLAPQPLREEYLLSGALEPTNEAYAVAKIAAVKLCQSFNTQHGTNFISAMPTNLYGPGDNFDARTSHVLPALLRKVQAALVSGGPVTIWGDGSPRREFLYVDDLAEAMLFLMERVDAERVRGIVNVGTGSDMSIAELAQTVARVLGYRGEFVHDLSKPNGTPRKVLDVSRMTALGWTAHTPLEDGILRTYRWFLDHAT